MDDDGSLTMELQAMQIAKNATLYTGSAPCPMCGVVMNPVEYLYGNGICPPCREARMSKRVKGKLAQ